MKEKRKNIILLLFIIYLIILTWIILFKMAFSFDEMPNLRNINLIPFAESAIVNNSVDFSELIKNAIAFIPVGIYVSMLKSDWSFLKKIIPVIALSMFYETFAIGATDITDVINNTIGGLVGILFYLLISKIIRNKEKLEKLIIVLASICTGLLVLLLSIILLANM